MASMCSIRCLSPSQPPPRFISVTVVTTMTTTEGATKLKHRHVNGSTTESANEESHTQDGDMQQWQTHAQKVKLKILEQIQEHVSGILDEALREPVQGSAEHLTKAKGKRAAKTSRMDDGKVFMERVSLLDELFEISHIRTIYHMFIAVLLIFCLSTLAVDYIDQGRLVLEFDLLVFAFGKLWTVTWVWALMFLHTLLVPYYSLLTWGSLYHRVQSKTGLCVVTSLVVSAVQSCVLGLFPLYVVVHHQLPPASRFIVILEQIRFAMKSYSFIRETAPPMMKNLPKEGLSPRVPPLSTYLYFLFAPTLIYRESYPRNRSVRWNYVLVTLGMIFSSLFYAYFILVRLCIPAFRPESKQPLSERKMILSIFHSILPGIMLLLLCFFAFLHCWLNLFAELLRFADRMFYKDWWNSTSFANYYRTWNVVVHDWLYYYGYRDFLWLSGRRFRAAAMLSVFIVSAVVHEYALTVGLGFFYPVMFFLFAVLGVVFNFTLNDNRQSPVFNIIMWACLFLGQGVQVCLYCQEWYAQIHCPRTGSSFWELVTPRSWSCQS
ncbi:sterol O-acyltransferase 2 [Synchiropus splendidus]|uniref:sterol O-acyltransferase 2 n=1 Tax=Synchiropus splendidus TaxID=270530 RepID=UPI00237E5264|nr:sterol O-acyltransferase 2 [Synchiropus splendidus]